ncbi:MAG: AbrB/MazE/SpoVT family DNA-binding domain-containing protein [Nanoarchaeota archaeon]
MAELETQKNQSDFWCAKDKSSLSITKMSSKGQIVIPKEMRKGFHEGEKFIIIKAGNQLILKSLTAFDENIADDLKFAKRTEAAWKSYERGEFKSMPVDEFLQELKKC